MGDDFELNGKQIYRDERCRVHLATTPDEHEMVFGGHYTHLPRGTLRGIGRGDKHALDYVMRVFVGSAVDRKGVESSLLKARVAELEDEVDYHIAETRRALGQ